MDQNVAPWRVALTRTTENFLTSRKRKKIRRIEKQKKKNVILDWVEAFIWAAFVVLLVNQYLLQAYKIPTGSMIETLLENDRIFVNKAVYGPELLPGLVKLPGFVVPTRNEVVIFENPAYIGRGTAFDVLQRIVYMMTLSLVDIDTDRDGRPRAQFLIKRAVGVDHDRFRQVNGNLMIRPHGEVEWYTESEFQRIAGIEYGVRRILRPEHYETILRAGRARAYETSGLAVAPDDSVALREYGRNILYDSFAFEEARAATQLAITPHDRRASMRFEASRAGWYIPEGRMFTLGDNRDNSQDGRNFGPVRSDRVLGRAMFRYWPLARIGLVR
ncbi:MAG: signal peptidase I [Spirochaetaceae bacterium]|nr:MAG: signal peptidase I [Spirochaetaceae bacterium]